MLSLMEVQEVIRSHEAHPKLFQFNLKYPETAGVHKLSDMK